MLDMEIRSGQCGEPLAWASDVGLVRVPLFGAARRTQNVRRDCAVFLDGPSSSFALCSMDDDHRPYGGDEPRSWSWSANLRHVLLLDRDELILRRWDSWSRVERVSLPGSRNAAERLLAHLASAPQPHAPDVVVHMLRAFRRLRASLGSHQALDAIRIFNAFLVGTELVRLGAVGQGEWLRARTVRDALKEIDSGDLEGTEVGDVSRDVLGSMIGPTLADFLQPDPGGDLHLEPDLLLRHAAGELYQEAHLVIGQDEDRALPGLGGSARPRGRPPRDVRFTRTALARALVEQAFDSCTPPIAARTVVDVLDPACGSGVFLQEALRELEARAFRGTVTVRGFDTSPLSCAIARFCLTRAKRDAEDKGMSVSLRIEKCDALGADWGAPDVVLMNPPFASWEDLHGQDREGVVEVLGPLRTGRADKAMAFVWRAVQALRPGAALGAVLPAAVLESKAGRKWREALLDQASLRLVGRFRGYGFFRGSVVEPSFVVLRRPAAGGAVTEPVRFLVAREGSEDAALRGLRQPLPTGDGDVTPAWELYETPASGTRPASWLPWPERQRRLVAELGAAGVTRVRHLFGVRQGARTGRRRVFLLTQHEYDRLPESERHLFRPAAGSSTIIDGRIEQTEFVFYPYGASEIATEDDLPLHVPTYYRDRLLPARAYLAARRGVDPQKWWRLTREREWQRVPCPKLVSKAFGRQGSFAYDCEGAFAVVQGFAWFWRGRGRRTFHASRLPWAYLAILNSPVFESILSCFCPRVQGGQFELTKKFVDEAFLPDLSDDLRFPSDFVQELELLGRRIHAGDMSDFSDLNGPSLVAYGLPAKAVAVLTDV